MPSAARSSRSSVAVGRPRAPGWATVHGNGRLSRAGSPPCGPPTTSVGFAIRAIVEQPGARASRDAPASPQLTITVYRRAIATFYGPGFFGSETACGEILRRSTLGVANRTLPCGTPVAIIWHGRSIVVPVIDRGPYANGADWDLTSATAQALGINSTETIGAVSLPR